MTSSPTPIPRLGSLLLVLAAAGCTGHASDYASLGFPLAPVVGATRDVYAATDATDRLSQPLEDTTVPAAPKGATPAPVSPRPISGRAGGAIDALRAEASGKPQSADPSAAPPVSPPAGAVFLEAGGPGALAARPRELRIWVAPWRDAAGDRIGAGYIFAGTEDRRDRAHPHGVGPILGPNHLQSVAMIEARGAPTAPLPGPGSGAAPLPSAPVAPRAGPGPRASPGAAETRTAGFGTNAGG